MRVLAFLCFFWVCSALPFDPQLPKRYFVDEWHFDRVEEENGLLRLVFDEGVFFSEKGARAKVKGWSSGDVVEVHRACADQAIVALCFDKEAVFAYASADLPKIQRHPIRFFSLRCSGSTYLQHLLRHHFLMIHFGQDIGWKHGPAYPSVQGFRQQAENIDELVAQDFDVKGERLKDPATIMIVRNPLDWVRSLYKNSWWVLHPSYREVSFADFLREPVRIGGRQPSDIDFFSHKPYESPLHMRMSKLKLLLSLTCRSPQHFVINYETLLENPAAVIAHIASTFGWRPKAVYEPIDYRIRSGGQKFEIPSYPTLSEDEVSFIKEHLDSQLEQLLSYDLN